MNALREIIKVRNNRVVIDLPLKKLIMTNTSALLISEKKRLIGNFKPSDAFEADLSV